MTKVFPVRRLKDVKRGSQLIRAKWTISERRQRRRLAATRQRKLMQWLREGQPDPTTAPCDWP
jgi:hypothetical protein